MNPLLINLAFFAISSIMLSAWWILPSFNLHFVNHNISSLRVQINQTLYQNRLELDKAKEQILQISNQAFEVSQIEETETNDYLILDISYKNKNLFGGKFSQAEGKKHMKFLIAKIQ